MKNFQYRSIKFKFGEYGGKNISFLFVPCYEAREKSEEMIDAMHAPFVSVRGKPRIYRQKASKAYLAVAKQKKPGYKKIRKARRSYTLTVDNGKEFASHESVAEAL